MKGGGVRSSIKRREVPTPISQTVPEKNPRSSLEGSHTQEVAGEEIKLSVSSDWLSVKSDKSEIKVRRGQNKTLKTLNWDKNRTNNDNNVEFTNISFLRQASRNQVLDGSAEKLGEGKMILDWCSLVPLPSTRRRVHYGDKERSPVVSGEDVQKSKF